MAQRTGVRRKTRLPLSVDLLPMDALESVKRLRSKWGMGWMEIERLSSLPYNKAWEAELGKHGFIDWDALPAKVLAKFPKHRVPHTNLHRWYDIRVQQAKEDVLARAAQAREIAEAFAKASLVNGDEAVLNAARDLIFELTQSADEKSRLVAGKYLLGLADVMQEARKNELRERKVAVDEQALQIKLDLVKQKAAKLIKTIEGGSPDKPVQLTREQLLERVKDIYGAV